MHWEARLKCFGISRADSRDDLVTNRENLPRLITIAPPFGGSRNTWWAEGVVDSVKYILDMIVDKLLALGERDFIFAVDVCKVHLKP